MRFLCLLRSRRKKMKQRRSETASGERPEAASGSARVPEEMRLNRYLSAAGVCSRREADRIIGEGRVRVNGIPASLGMVIREEDRVFVDGKPVQPGILFREALQQAGELPFPLPSVCSSPCCSAPTQAPSCATAGRKRSWHSCSRWGSFSERCLAASSATERGGAGQR